MNSIVLLLSFCLATAVLGSFLHPFHAQSPAYVSIAADQSDRAAFHGWVDSTAQSPSDTGFPGFSVHSSGSCRVNVCYAFDGSSSINRRAFQAEKDFAKLVDKEIRLGYPNGAAVAGIQYASEAEIEFRLTQDPNTANQRIDMMRQMGGGTNTGIGIFECGFLLWKVKEQARHIIILTDGNANMGPDGAAVARAMRESGAVVSVVATGYPNPRLLDALAGPNGKVYRVDSFNDATAMARISVQLGRDICN